MCKPPLFSRDNYMLALFFLSSLIGVLMYPLFLFLMYVTIIN